MPELSILTVVHRSAAMLEHAQQTLAAKLPACDFEWIVVNHSPDIASRRCRRSKRACA